MYTLSPLTLGLIAYIYISIMQTRNCCFSGKWYYISIITADQKKDLFTISLVPFQIDIFIDQSIEQFTIDFSFHLKQIVFGVSPDVKFLQLE